VTSNQATSLRLHVEEHPDEQLASTIPQIAPLCSAFEKATGWQLRYEQSPAGPGEAWSATIETHGQPVGRLVLSAPHRENAKGSEPCVDLHEARPLALAIGNLLTEISRLKQAVWQREAELAAGVPVAARRDEEPHLADRLEAVLKGGAEALGCQAAGLYLLDDATSELKLRAMWGLPEERLLAPARTLRGATADLEALVGHAVVLEDVSLTPNWRCPEEEFSAAVCVPVSSPSIPLGTLWVFSNEPRDFSPEQTNLLEIIAGRLAADLEREMLLAAGTKAKERDRQLELAARWMADRLPSITPLIDDYEFSAWTQQAGCVGGDFHDWTVLSDGRIALTVGDADGELFEAALGAASLHYAIKAHASHSHSATDLLSRVNESLIAASPGDQRASLAYALVEPDSGAIELSLAGATAAILVRADDREVTTTDAPSLGEMSEAEFQQDCLSLKPGEALIMISGGVRTAIDGAGLRIGEAAIASHVARHLCESADGLVARLRRLLDHDAQAANDLTVLVVKRRSLRSS
jgi:serine phosphatase RsbU (regulator of sigma subunit)